MACSHRSFLMTLSLAVATACTTACTIAYDTVATATSTVYTLCARAVDWVIERMGVVAKRLARPLLVPRVDAALVQARAFVLRLAKRETPRLTPGWRMCPSI
jgi:hypothetical protein